MFSIIIFFLFNLIFYLEIIYVYRFLSMARAITDNADASVSGQRQSAKVESGYVLFRPLV